MAYLVVLAAVALTVVLGGGAVVFLLLRRRSRVAAAVAAFLTVAGLTAFFPIPTHGGFIFLFEVALHELRQTSMAVVEVRDEVADERFWRRQSERFGRTLSVASARDLAGSWREVRVSDGGHAWLDTSTGLLWSDVVELHAATPMPPLDDARELCRQLLPSGAWTVPSEGDQYSFWRSQGATLLPGRTASQVSYLVEADLHSEMPVYHLSGGGSNQVGAGPGRTLRVRCLARTSAAPEAGWARADIPLEEWNRFQLEKMAPAREHARF